jgi:hypothetical protein
MPRRMAYSMRGLDLLQWSHEWFGSTFDNLNAFVTEYYEKERIKEELSRKLTTKKNDLIVASKQPTYNNTQKTSSECDSQQQICDFDT